MKTDPLSQPLKKDRYDIIIIGGGPAGLSAAAEAAKTGVSVLVAEKTASCGRKLLISGSGRCNITNISKSSKEFLSRVRNGKFLYQALNGFSTEDTVSFFRSHGIKTAVEHGFKVFPETGGSADVLHTLMREAATAGVDFICNFAVDRLNLDGETVVSVSSGDRFIYCSAVIIATGGMSYPKTGSAGEGYLLAGQAGHNIKDPVPALVPAYSQYGGFSELQGLSLRNVGLSVIENGKKRESVTGDLVFTDEGLSGPAVYDLSRETDTQEEGITLAIDLFPEEKEEKLDKRLEKALKENHKKQVKTVLETFMPASMTHMALNSAGVFTELKAANLGARDRKKLVEWMKGIEVNGVSFAGFERAVVTRGGVDTKEVDGRQMASKKADNLFFAGEVLDVDGPTGGYNLQICWSTGRLAGKSASAYVKNKN